MTVDLFVRQVLVQGTEGHPLFQLELLLSWTGGRPQTARLPQRVSRLQPDPMPLSSELQALAPLCHITASGHDLVRDLQLAQLVGHAAQLVCQVRLELVELAEELLDLTEELASTVEEAQDLHTVVYWNLLNLLQSTGIYCSPLESNLLESTTIYWNLLESTGIYWNPLESTAIYWNLLQSIGIYCSLLESTAIYCSLLRIYCNLLQSTAIYCSLLESTGIHWNVLSSDLQRTHCKD